MPVIMRRPRSPEILSMSAVTLSPPGEDSFNPARAVDTSPRDGRNPSHSSSGRGGGRVLRVSSE
eukprot:1496974-Heterocapsa_arctica.AAC.1